MRLKSKEIVLKIGKSFKQDRLDQKQRTILIRDQKEMFSQKSQKKKNINFETNLIIFFFLLKF